MNTVKLWMYRETYNDWVSYACGDMRVRGDLSFFDMLWLKMRSATKSWERVQL